MSWLAGLRGWWNDPRRRMRTRSRRELRRLFEERRDLLRSTSLRPEHGNRVQLLDTRDQPWEILFGIVRHPRPYTFSKQSHEVVEVWCYRVEQQQVERLTGHNLTVERGEDGEAPW
jgi:hypothetical protein